MQLKRKFGFRLYKGFLKLFKTKSLFVDLGDGSCQAGIMLCNHVSTKAPLSVELFMDKPTRMWGAHEMNRGIIKTYKYQTRVYYHEKKGWPLFPTRIYCLLASPLTSLFYTGIDLIETFRDVRFYKTISQTYETLKKGVNVVIFPEDSTNGYLDELEGFHDGFLVALEYCYKKGLDVPVYLTYFCKQNGIHIIDKPVMYSELIKDGESREQIAKRLLDRTNELGRMARAMDRKTVKKQLKQKAKNK